MLPKHDHTLIPPLLLEPLRFSSESEAVYNYNRILAWYKGNVKEIPLMSGHCYAIPIKAPFLFEELSYGVTRKIYFLHFYETLERSGEKRFVINLDPLGGPMESMVRISEIYGIDLL